MGSKIRQRETSLSPNGVNNRYQISTYQQQIVLQPMVSRTWLRCVELLSARVGGQWLPCARLTFWVPQLSSRREAHRWADRGRRSWLGAATQSLGVGCDQLRPVGVDGWTNCRYLEVLPLVVGAACRSRQKSSMLLHSTVTKSCVCV